MSPIIEVKNLGKKYNITHQRGGYVALRDVLTTVFKNPFKFAKHKARQIVGLEIKEEFWALKDINFSVEPGEIIGIIGCNGAGKSTLLKILSQITPPTEGEIIMRGKAASLLEVGTGFHPELTGRENIFLNGAILGMTKKEIIKKFDAIVDFAGIEKFLDTPVKYYSSGMYVRLAFSVAAHMEPDILLIDEVLAVGDAEFQKKCLGKMNEITKKEGRTILFVSHNMEAIKNICQKCILIDNGKIKEIGEVNQIISAYFKEKNDKEIQFPFETSGLIIHDFKISQNENLGNIFNSDEKINIRVNFELKRNLELFRIGIYIKTVNEELIARSLLADWNHDLETIKSGRYIIQGHIPEKFLFNGKYTIELHASRYGIIDYGLGNNLYKQISISSPVEYNKIHKEEKPFGFVLLNPEWHINNYS